MIVPHCRKPADIWGSAEGELWERSGGARETKSFITWTATEGRGSEVGGREGRTGEKRTNTVVTLLIPGFVLFRSDASLSVFYFDH